MSDPSNEAFAPITPALSRDMTLMLAQLRVEMIQASVVAIDTLAVVSSWSSVQGDRMDVHSPLAAALVPKLEGMPASHTVAHRLGADYWAFAWRFDEGHAVVATAFYRDRRDVQGSSEMALVRLVCDIGLRGGEVETEVPEDVQAPLGWPAFERRRRVRTAKAPRRGPGLYVAGAGLVTALTLVTTFMTFNQAIAHETGATRLQALAEGAMTQTLSTALATGDYGEVQSALSSFSSLGYFNGAVVTNARHRVISAAGKIGNARIGEEVPPSLALTARGFDLGTGTSQHGQLLVVGMAVDRAGDTPVRWLLLATVIGCLATGLSAALLALRRRSQPARKATR